ncbi:hypothetical protein F2P56_030499 [Juglans regia]|uniref:Protein ALP1-like n=2 Tax=Juglans regia TaxID=51240 RepID=A0A833TZX3_JUGRE|nr:uncharacterized protein LOC108988480 [Juglans regia]KAF5450124.1 hypothetical protein F2P56_030499 [Juglans regia]
MGYYLTDGIYPKCSTFVKTIPSPQGNKKKHFAAAQELVRKDVKRAFEVIQQRFAIICGPSRMLKIKDFTSIIKACVILHNMIFEEKRDDNLVPNIEYDQLDDEVLKLLRNRTTELMDFI